MTTEESASVTPAEPPPISHIPPLDFERWKPIDVSLGQDWIFQNRDSKEIVCYWRKDRTWYTHSDGEWNWRQQTSGQWQKLSTPIIPQLDPWRAEIVDLTTDAESTSSGTGLRCYTTRPYMACLTVSFYKISKPLFCPWPSPKLLQPLPKSQDQEILK